MANVYTHTHTQQQTCTNKLYTLFVSPSTPPPPHHPAYMECRVSSLIKSRRSYYFWDRLNCPRSVAPMAVGL